MLVDICVCVYVCVCVCMCVCVCVCVCVDENACGYMCACLHVSHTNIPTYLTHKHTSHTQTYPRQLCVCVCVCVCVYVYTHTHTHIYMRAHTHLSRHKLKVGRHQRKHGPGHALINRRQPTLTLVHLQQERERRRELRVGGTQQEHILIYQQIRIEIPPIMCDRSRFGARQTLGARPRKAQRLACYSLQ
jgi:hypothetical protein